MSAFLLGLGFRADMGTCARKLVLLKLIDACEDDGTRIFPAIATVARAAQCSPRQVQRELKAFQDVGLLRLVKAGGNGPRSTNEYALDLDLLQKIGKAGWDSYVAAHAPAPPAEAKDKGDTVSPLDCDTYDAAAPLMGDADDTPRVTPETDKGDSACHPTPYYPSSDPSIERERERTRREEGKKIEQAFERAFQAWPTSVGDSRPEALRAWMALSADDRIAAVAEAGRYIAASKAMGRKHIVAYGTYLRERRWTQLPAQEVPKPVDLEASPFGKLWGAVRLKQLVTLPPQASPALTFTERAMLAQKQGGHREAFERDLVLGKQARFGWPGVNRMHERAAHGQGVMAAPELEALAAGFERVRVGSELWHEWEFEHRTRGWPWLPDPGKQEWVFFPAGGPGGLGAFEALVFKGSEDVRGSEQAA